MVKRETVLNLRLLSSSQREEFIRRVKSIRMPYDVGRLPSNIFDSSDEMNGVNGRRTLQGHASTNSSLTI